MTAPPSPDEPFAIHAREFVAMMAALMAMNALAIDSMLPALPAIARELGAPDPNAQQFVISSYLLGGAIGALASGPLSDRLGRKPVLLGAALLYVLAAVASALSGSFGFLIACRFVHGLIASAFGVVSVSVVRDRFAGDRMARAMSTIFIVFMLVPVLAPSFGQLVLYVAPWQAIFGVLAVAAAAVGGWVARRLPETLPGELRVAPRGRELAAIWRGVVTNRIGAGYSFGSGIISGALFGYLNSSQQIFAETFGVPELFPYAFAAVAGTMAVANFFNSRIVERFGARRVSQTALIMFMLLSAAQVIAALSGAEPMALFLTLIALNMGMIGFTGANFGSIAMQPFGHVAGAASSVQTFVRMGLGALVGAWIGQLYDGTTLPLALGFLLCGLGAFALILWTERGRLFTRPNAPQHIGAG